MWASRSVVARRSFVDRSTSTRVRTPMRTLFFVSLLSGCIATANADAPAAPATAPSSPAPRKVRRIPVPAHTVSAVYTYDEGAIVARGADNGNAFRITQPLHSVACVNIPDGTEVIESGGEGTLHFSARPCVDIFGGLPSDGHVDIDANY